MHSFVILVIFSVFFSTQHLKSSSFEITPEKPTKLTSRNFHIILSLDDPWIVIFLEDYDAAKQAELVALATSVVGLVQIGFVDMDDSESEELVEAKVIQDSVFVFKFENQTSIVLLTTKFCEIFYMEYFRFRLVTSPMFWSRAVQFTQI